MNRIRNICYVTTTARIDNPFMDPSSRYRCYHPAAALAGIGVKSRVMSADLFLRYPVGWCDAYVFHHPVYSEQLAAFVEQARKEGKPVVADYGARPKGFFSAIRLFDRFSVATISLRDEVLAVNPDAGVTVVPDLLSPVEMELARMFPRRKRSGRRLLATYFAEGDGWREDFNLMDQALLVFLEEFPQARYLHIGADIPPGPLSDHPRTRAEPEFDPRRLSLTLSRSDVLLLPQAVVPGRRSCQKLQISRGCLPGSSRARYARVGTRCPCRKVSWCRKPGCLDRRATGYGKESTDGG